MIAETPDNAIVAVILGLALFYHGHFHKKYVLKNTTFLSKFKKLSRRTSVEPDSRLSKARPKGN
jgi:hypothetical protein